MNSNQMMKIKGANLSATAKGQDNINCSNNSSNSPRENKCPESEDSSYSKAHECSGGVCQTNWKPVAHIA